MTYITSIYASLLPCLLEMHLPLLADAFKSGDKWPKFKEIGTKKIELAKVVVKEKKNLAQTLHELSYIIVTNCSLFFYNAVWEASTCVSLSSLSRYDSPCNSGSILVPRFWIVSINCMFFFVEG